MGIAVGDPLPLEEPDDEVMWIEIVKAIDHMAMIVEVEADSEVHGGIDHHFLEALPAEK